MIRKNFKPPRDLHADAAVHKATCMFKTTVRFIQTLKMPFVQMLIGKIILVETIGVSLNLLFSVMRTKQFVRPI